MGKGRHMKKGKRIIARCNGDLVAIGKFIIECADGKYEITLYTSCCNATQGIYYYTTYDNHQISAVDMHRENLDGETLRCFAPVTGEQIHM